MLKNITIIGLGEVGSTLCNLLLSRQGTSINVIDPASIDGRILDLNHAATIYNSKIYWNDFDLAKKADVLFYTAGYSNKVNESRNTVAEKNKSLIESIFSQLDLKKECLIVSVSNPVELTSKWIHDISDNTVIGTGTSLESYRLKFYQEELGFRSKNIDDYLVIGEHGKRMVPVWTNQESTGINLKETESKLIESAFTIRQTETATKYGVAQCCVDILNRFEADESTNLPISFKVDNQLMQSLNLSEEIFVSLPCILGSKQITIDQNFIYTPETRERLKAAAQKIESLYTNHK